MNCFKLSNGISVSYYPVLQTHSISLGLYIKVGSRYEDPSNNGITHLLEHLHFRRLGVRTQSEIYYDMESIGSTLRATTYKDFVRYYMKIRPNYINKGISFFKEILNTFEWELEEFIKEKKVVLNQIYEKESYLSIDPYLNQTIWKKSSLSLPIMGTEETVTSIQLSDVIEYKRRFFCPENIAFYITGCISSFDIESINNTLSSIVFCKSFTKKLPNYQSIKNVQRKPDVSMVSIRADYLDAVITFDIDYNIVTREELTLLNCILGEGVGSKLQSIIREENGLTANIYSQVEEYKDIAVIHIKFSIHKKHFYNCLEQIINVLKNMKAKITKSEFKTTLPFYTENLWFWLDDPEELNFQLAYNSYILERADFDIKDKISLYKRIDEDRLTEVARSIFKSSKASIVILGSVSKITKKNISDIIKRID